MFVERDKMKKGGPRTLLSGVGINDATYSTRCRLSCGKVVTCPYYTRWASMLSRCYSKSYQSSRPSYVGCTVAKEWHTFSVFRDWMKGQRWKGKSLDKDLIVPDNREYGPDTCIFVDSSVNSLLVNSDFSNSSQGVRVSAQGKYNARVMKDGKVSHVGNYETEEEAIYEYNLAKANHIRDVAARYFDPALFKALTQHARVYEEVASRIAVI